MKDYINTGKHVLNATLRITEADDKGAKVSKLVDISVSPGQQASLPEDNPHIESLVAAGLLKDPNPIAKK